MVTSSKDMNVDRLVAPPGDGEIETVGEGVSTVTVAPTIPVGLTVDWLLVVLVLLLLLVLVELLLPVDDTGIGLPKILNRTSSLPPSGVRALQPYSPTIPASATNDRLNANGLLTLSPMVTDVVSMMSDPL
jgi:hypothetical protein